MAMAPLHVCLQRGCPVLVERGKSHCAEHARQPWAKSDATPKRISGRRLQRKRRYLFARYPLCVLCRAQGQRTLATIRDHIVPLAEGGAEDSTNEQALCQDCSDAKTQAEALRGRQRSR
jgi:5-methylcytosine-specific restriction enzyme A